MWMDSKTNTSTLSIVSTLFMRPEFVSELLERITKTVSGLGFSNYEIILIDDACPLGSGDQARKFLNTYSSLRVVTLSRNFGQHSAIIHGLSISSGDFVFLLDGDLDEDPELLNRFWDEMLRKPVEVVFGYQDRQRRGFLDRVLGNFGYWMLNRFSDFRITPNMLNARLMSRKYVDALMSFEEKSPFLAAMWESVGFEKTGIKCQKHSRASSSYSFLARLNFFFRGVTYSSTKLASLISWLGVLMFTFGNVVLIASFFQWVQGVSLPGWTSTVGSIWSLSGTIMFSIGVLAHYLKIIILETKNRPLVIVDKDSGSTVRKPRASGR